MERQTFILLHKKDFRLTTTLFLKADDGKLDKRSITFTTEHKVTEKERNRNARTIPSEFSTSDEKIYDGLLRDTGYGKTWVLSDDPEGKMKREAFNITPADAKKVALKNLFEDAGLKFDGSKSNDVLEEEYQIFANAKAGTKISRSGPSKVAHTPANPKKDIEDQVNKAKAIYLDRYNEDIPSDFANDKALLSALIDDPKFDAKAYIEKTSDAPVVTEGDNIEALRSQYKDKFGVNVANNKKNDAAWIKTQLEKEDK